MATSALAIVNSALLRLGERPITQSEFDTPTTPAGEAALAFYATTRDEEFRANPWVFTLVRDTLLAYSTPAATLTPAAVTGSGIVFTAGSNIFVTADIGKTLEHQAGAGKALITALGVGTEPVATVTADITEDFPGTGAIAAGDWRLYNAAPANTWLRSIPKPDGLLRLWTVRYGVPYRAEGQGYVTDADSLEVVYISRIEDTTLFDADFDEALAARLAIKFAIALPGKFELVQLMTPLYQAVIQRAKSTSAIEIGEGKFEVDPEDPTVATVIQDAVHRVGEFPAPSGGDPIDPTEMANHFFPIARDELLTLWGWRFARKRVRLDATTTQTLTPGAVTGDAVTFTASGASFVATDVGARIIADGGGVARIVTVTDAVTATADIEADFASTDPIAAGAWHLAPPWRWGYRYPVPSDYLRLTEAQCPTWWLGQPVSWTWWGGWRGVGWRPGVYQEPVVREGTWLVTDAGPTIDIEYASRSTDPALWDATYRSALAALLAARMALPLTGKPQIAQLLQIAFAGELAAVRAADKINTTRPVEQPNSLIRVRG